MRPNIYQAQTVKGKKGSKVEKISFPSGETAERALPKS